MTAPRVFVDFQNADAQGRLRLNCAGTLDDLSTQKIELKEGMSLALYEDDVSDTGEPDEILVQGTAAYSKEEGCWVAVIDWNAVKHASELSKQPARANGVPAPSGRHKKPA